MSEEKVFCWRYNCGNKVSKKDWIEVKFHYCNVDAFFCSFKCFSLWVWDNYLHNKAKVVTQISIEGE